MSSANIRNRNENDPYGFILKSKTPTKVLVINCGSSSLKYTLFDTSVTGPVVNGQVERIGTGSSMAIEFESSEIEFTKDLAPGDHKDAFDAVLSQLSNSDYGVITSPEEIKAVGHRVVHGGDIFTAPTILNDETIAKIESVSSLAPLHNPVNLVGIREAMRAFSSATHVAVFDTAFHHTIPEHAFLYGLPYEFYTEKKIRRYGFHGTSHSYVSLKTAEYLGRPYNDLKIITAHLGNGGSLCAVENGKSVDTSMGLTPAEGLIMGTRCGNIDPAALLHLMDSEDMSSSDINTLINKKSGLLGLSGISNDMRDIEAAVKSGDKRAEVAYKTYSYAIRKYIGSYSAVMGGCDALVFTGGVGLYSSFAREEICKGLGALGMFIDKTKNIELNGKKDIVEISTPDSPVKILIIPTDEELMIARDTLSSIADDNESAEPLEIPVEISAHHIHLCREDVETLFGKGHNLVNKADLSQPGQFACEEQVTITGPKGSIKRIRVLGPERPATQIEIALTEQYALGVRAPIRESGTVAGSPGITIEGTVGKVELKEGVIVAKRHIHMHPDDATAFGVKDRDIVGVLVKTENRSTTFDDVVIRVNEAFRLAFHIDTDEANAAGVVGTEVKGYLV